MKGVEGSKLLLLGESGEEHGRDARVTLRASFAARGIAPERVEFVGRRARRGYLELHDRIDIALDTFPYHGHTTTLDALWMGVPTVTMRGQTRAAREGPAMLEAVGLEDLAADDGEAFVRIATKLADDPPRLRELRKSLRERMTRSALMDAGRVAEGIEAAVLHCK
jgi:predicted O-linked N-acetylglucosamine transferase (SPINDLY family)